MMHNYGDRLKPINCTSQTLMATQWQERVQILATHVQTELASELTSGLASELVGELVGERAKELASGLVPSKRGNS